MILKGKAVIDSQPFLLSEVEFQIPSLKEEFD
ncbi:MAG: hypothetical protein K0S23_589 [Fluviicola sp.]|jgi:hypothetical protein|nr:hypothetical protein [Fluviicola sp.]